MERIWSKYLQSSEMLYHTRALRFREDNKDQWLSLMKLRDGMRVLDIGCGGGIFSHRIKTFLPGAIVMGVDRDIDHIAYAKQKSRALGLDCAFVVGDAQDLPFDDDSFDATISYTVMEHIEPVAFLREQLRVLRPGGGMCAMCVWQSAAVYLNMEDKRGEEEKALWTKAWAHASDFDKKHGVCAYPPDGEYPRKMEAAGFIDVAIDTLSAVRYAPDSTDVGEELALRQIEGDRINALDSLTMTLRIAPNLTDAEAARLRELINERIDARIEKYRRGEKVWDFVTSGIIAFTGRKP